MKFFLNGLDVDSMARDLSNGLRHISFDDNFDGFFWEGEIAAGEEVSIPNLLFGQNGQKIVPSGVVFTHIEGPPLISVGLEPWTEEFVYLLNRATTSYSTVRAFFLKGPGVPSAEVRDTSLRILEISYGVPPTDGQVATFDDATETWVPATPNPPTADAFVWDDATWTPDVTVPGGSGLVVDAYVIDLAEFKTVGDFVFFNFRATVDFSGSDDTQVLFSLPVVCLGENSACFASEILDGTVIPVSGRCNTNDENTAALSKYDASNITATTGIEIAASGCYHKGTVSTGGRLMGILGLTYPS